MFTTWEGMNKFKKEVTRTNLCGLCYCILYVLIIFVSNVHILRVFNCVSVIVSYSARNSILTLLTFAVSSHLLPGNMLQHLTQYICFLVLRLELGVFRGQTNDVMDYQSARYIGWVHCAHTGIDMVSNNTV